MTRTRNHVSRSAGSCSVLEEPPLLPFSFAPGAGPSWRQPRGKSMVYSVNTHTNATRIGWHMWEIDLGFAPGLPPGWFAAGEGFAGVCGRERVRLCHPGGNPWANLKSISHRCYLFEVAVVWALTKETIVLPLGCLQGGSCMRGVYTHPATLLKATVAFRSVRSAPESQERSSPSALPMPRQSRWGRVKQRRLGVNRGGLELEQHRNPTPAILSDALRCNQPAIGVGDLSLDVPWPSAPSGRHCASRWRFAECYSRASAAVLFLSSLLRSPGAPQKCPRSGGARTPRSFPKQGKFHKLENSHV